MSLIRKPDIEVFRDSSTVTALRGAKTLVQEGGGTAARTVSNIWLSVMLIAFIMTGLGAMTGARTPLAFLACAALILAAVGALIWLWRAPTRERAVEDGAAPLLDNLSVPLPEHLRDQVPVPVRTDGFHVKYWPKAFVNQATLLLIFGSIGLSYTLRSPGMWTLLTGLMVVRGLMLLSIFFRGGVCVTAKPDRLCVRSLIGENEMLWSDVIDVRTETFDRSDYWILASTGARHHIVVSGHHRLGSNKLLIPYKLLGLDSNGVRDLVRRLLTQAEFARSRPQATSPAASPGFGQRRSAPTISDEPGSSFDPDAIIRRYMAERDQLMEDHAAIQASIQTPVQRPAGGFGRKRVG